MQRHTYKHGGKISFVTKHLCKLDALEIQRELPSVAPYATTYQKCLYNLRKWTIASRWHPRSKQYFRSHSALFKEKRRQLRSKKFKVIVHPLSKLAMIRQIFMTVLWTITFFVDPMFGTFMERYTNPKDDTSQRDLCRMILNCIFLADIVVQFFMGFTVERTKEIILDQRRIVLNYLNGYFIYDVIPVIYGIFCFILSINAVKTALGIDNDFAIWLSVPQLYAFRFVRIYTLAYYFYNSLCFFNVKEAAAKCATLAILIMIIIHWWTCILFLVPSISYYMNYPLTHSYVLRNVISPSLRQRLDFIYTETLLNVVCHFFGAGKGNIETKNPFEQLILSLILISGTVLHIYVIALILQLFGTINVSETKYEALIYQLNEYMVTKKLPQMLRKRLLMYYEYRFQKQFFLEHLILNSLSEHLRCEVLLYSCKNLINKVKLFQGAPKEVIGALVAMLKHEIFLPNDHIIKPDAMNEHVYFISFGTVAVYLPNGKEAYHLEDGHHFGEVQVVLHGYGEQYLTSVMAIEITEVFYLDKRDFWYVVATHPEIADSLEKSALAKLMTYKSLLAESTENIVDTGDILVELRKGRILDRGRRRT